MGRPGKGKKRGMPRRAFLGSAIAAGVVCRGLRAAEVDHGGWVRRTISLQPRADLTKRPVVTAVALRPSADQLALAGDDHLIRIWDLEHDVLVRDLDGHGDWVRTLQYSPDGTRLASAGNDGRMIVWNAESGRREHEQEVVATLTQLAFDRSGRQMMTVGFRDRLRLIDLATGAEMAALGCPCVDMRALAVSPDNRLIAAGGRNGRVRVWDLERGEVLAEFAAHRQRIRALDFSPASDRIASCGEDRAVRISFLDGRLDYELPVVGGKVMSLVFYGHTQLVTGSSDNLIRIWDLGSRTEVATLAGHTGSVVALAAAEEVLVSAGYDTAVRVWHPARNVAEDRREEPQRVGERRESSGLSR